MDFLFCPYDGNRLVMDSSVEVGRPRCAICGFVHYSNPAPCVAVMIVERGQLLLTRRGIEPQKGKLDLPGGFLQWGESAEDAAIRECKEELHVLVDRGTLVFLGSLPDTYGSTGVHTVNLCFLAAIESGVPTSDSDVASIEWHDLDHLPNDFAFDHQSHAIRSLKDYLTQHMVPTTFHRVG